MIHFSLFSGIGGFETAAEWAGWRNLLSCEINEFGNKVREYYWPEGYHHTDIHTLNYDTINIELSKRFGTHWRNEDIILTGGFPCQPYSMAGKRKGKEDERHLWPEMLRVIREVAPTWVVGENVGGLISWSGGLVFEEVQADLEAEGYEVQPYVLPACAVDAPHRRDRVCFIAYSRSNERFNLCRQKTSIKGGSKKYTRTAYNGCNGATTDTQHQRLEGHDERIRCAEYRSNEGVQSGTENKQSITDTNGRRQPSEEHRKAESSRITENGIPGDWENFPTQSPICDRNDGLSSRLSGITFPKWRNESIKAMGNAIVPQVAFQIFKAINQYSQP